MDVRRAVDSIRVARDFADRPITDQDLGTILDAGRRAGSSKNLQRWDFVVVRDKKRLGELGRVGPWAGHVGAAAAAIALVTPDPHDPDQPLSVMFDLGRAAQNMVLTAWELGIVSCPATVYEHELVTKILQLPGDRHCEYILSFGYPIEESVLTAPKAGGGRRTLPDVRHDETW